MANTTASAAHVKAQEMLMNILGRHYGADQLTASDDGAVYVHNETCWAEIVTVPDFAGRYDNSFQITKGYQAGVHLNGEIEFEETVENVGGVAFGVRPRILQWVTPAN